jgi:hypothetical protein
MVSRAMPGSTSIAGRTAVSTGSADTSRRQHSAFARFNPSRLPIEFPQNRPPDAPFRNLTRQLISRAIVH